MNAPDADQPPVPRAAGRKIPGALTKNVLLDPGIVYTLADVLLFAGTSIVGFSAMAGAMGVAMGLKALSVLQPGFLLRHPRICRVAFDDRTPLRVASLALVAVGAAAVATGAWLPAAASFLFAMANFRLAESISRREKKDPSDNEPSFVRTIKLTALRPELYLNAGFACAGLMAGGAALFTLPVVVAAFGIGMRNAVKDRPEHAGHPKIITAGAAAAFAAIGQVNGHGLIALAHAVNAVVLVEMERRVTEGGHRAILKDLAGKAISTPAESMRVAGELSQHPVRWSQAVQQKTLPRSKRLVSAFKAHASRLSHAGRKNTPPINFPENLASGPGNVPRRPKVG